MRFNFLAVGLGFIFQTAFLSVRGHALGRCPLTNLFEVFVFLAWSVALMYMLVGPLYRLSLMGAFTAPLVVLLQGFALVAPIDNLHPAALVGLCALHVRHCFLFFCRPHLGKLASCPRYWVLAGVGTDCAGS